MKLQWRSRKTSRCHSCLWPAISSDDNNNIIKLEVNSLLRLAVCFRPSWPDTQELQMQASKFYILVKRILGSSRPWTRCLSWLHACLLRNCGRDCCLYTNALDGSAGKSRSAENDQVMIITGETIFCSSMSCILVCRLLNAYNYHHLISQSYAGVVLLSFWVFVSPSLDSGIQNYNLWHVLRYTLWKAFSGNMETKNLQHGMICALSFIWWIIFTCWVAISSASHHLCKAGW